MNNDFKYDDDELRKDAPKLFGMEKKNPFEVPDGFFDSFSSKIQDKIAAEKKQSVWSLIYQNITRPKVAIPVLASVCIIVVGIKFLYTPGSINRNDEVAITYNDLSQSAYLDDIDESVLTDALNQTTSTVNSDSKTESDSYRIENYLIENNIDVTDLENELN
ncbi:MAG: hypothetical protein ABI723_12550 [Bacteroidia bacterium]